MHMYIIVKLIFSNVYNAQFFQNRFEKYVCFIFFKHRETISFMRTTVYFLIETKHIKGNHRQHSRFLRVLCAILSNLSLYSRND